MNVRLSNVWLVFRREVLDQLRDQRTLFMIFVLPVLLYPLLGIGIAQLTAAFAEKQRTVVVVGAEYLPKPFPAHLVGAVVGGGALLSPRSAMGTIPLLGPEPERFNRALFELPSDADRLHVVTAPYGPPWIDPERQRALLRAGEADALVLVPPDVMQTLASLQRVEIPIAYNSADERSQLTCLRVERVIRRWNERILELRRLEEGKPEGYTEPVRSDARDVASQEEAGGTVWAKVFPFLLVLMALTGAFYPSIDLCAGEKERGTMETLLISPASRPEIVLGKFLTVMLASNLMAVLNLASMGATAWALASQLQDAPAPPRAGGLGVGQLLRGPSLVSAGWMLLLLVPLSAFFSALCVALAVLARSMKEGQYYMTPVYMIAMPLAIVALAPGVELDMFTSLLPVTGVSLLLRSLMQGDYELARRYFLPVLVPIVIYGLVALRWAVDQFKSESVLFRGGERVSLAGWLRHLWRDKQPTPSPAQALLCFVLMLVATWFLMPWLGSSLLSMVAMQVLVILGIPTVMALTLTSNPRRTLRFRRPRAWDLALGAVLALALFPLVTELGLWVESTFPTPDAIKEWGRQLQTLIPNIPVALLVLAVAPAVCEELAFRGYMLSGLERAYRPAWAIVLSALLFGFMHVLLSLFNQLFNATLLGLVLGLLAVKSRSLFPCIVFHLVNNSLGVLSGTLATDPSLRALADLLLRERGSEHVVFQTRWLLLGSIVALVLLFSLMLRRPGVLRGAPSPSPSSRSMPAVPPPSGAVTVGKDSMPERPRP